MSMNPIIEALNNEQMKTNLLAFAPGDTVVIQVKVKEGTRERLQAYEGVVIAKSNRGLHSSVLCEKFRTVLGSSVPSNCTRLSSIQSKLSVAGMFAKPSFIISVNCLARRHVSRRSWILNNPVESSGTELDSSILGKSL